MSDVLKTTLLVFSYGGSYVPVYLWFSGGSSYLGASGGSSYGKVDGTEFTTGSGGGGGSGGAGGSFIKIDVGQVGALYIN